MQRIIAACAAAAVACSALVACTNEVARNAKNSSGATEICDKAFTGQAAAALEDATEDREFADYFGKDDMDRSITEFLHEIKAQGDSAGPPSDRYDMCLVYTVRNTDLWNMKVEFSTTKAENSDIDDVDPDFVVYPIARNAFASHRTAMIYFECRSPRLTTSQDEPVFIWSQARRRYAPDHRTEKDAIDNLRIAHALTLKLARELQCENDGGLPKNPVVKPVS